MCRTELAKCSSEVSERGASWRHLSVLFHPLSFIFFLSPPTTLSDFMRNSLSDSQCFTLLYSHFDSPTSHLQVFPHVLELYCFPSSYDPPLPLRFKICPPPSFSSICPFLSLSLFPVPSSCCSGVCLQVENVQQMLWP